MQIIMMKITISSNKSSKPKLFRSITSKQNFPDTFSPLKKRLVKFV